MGTKQPHLFRKTIETQCMFYLRANVSRKYEIECCSRMTSKIRCYKKDYVCDRIIFLEYLIRTLIFFYILYLCLLKITKNQYQVYIFNIFFLFKKNCLTPKMCVRNLYVSCKNNWFHLNPTRHLHYEFENNNIFMIAKFLKHISFYC